MFRVYEVIGAGAYERALGRFLAKCGQRNRIKRFCLTKDLRCVETSLLFGNFEQDVITACNMYKCGFADAILVSSLNDWSVEEKEYLIRMSEKAKVKVINLDELNYI